MGLLDIYANTDISNPYMQQGQDHSIIKDWAKQNPYAAASIATMPLPITSAALGLKADYDMYKNDPDSRKWYNYALSGLGVLPLVPPASAIVRSGIQGNLLQDAGNIAQDVKTTASNIKQGARNLFDVNNYNTPSYGLLANTVESIPAVRPDPGSASKNYLGMFVGKKDPRFKEASRKLGEKFYGGQSDEELFRETGIMRDPVGKWKGGADLENALEVTDDYVLNEYQMKKFYGNLPRNSEFIETHAERLRLMSKASPDFNISNSNTHYQNYLQSPTIKDLLQGKDINDLLSAYPEVGKTKVIFNINKELPNASGSFNEYSNAVDPNFIPTIIVNARNEREALDVLKHEMQHNIQAIENWTLGGNPNIKVVRRRLEKNINRLPTNIREDIHKLSLLYRNNYRINSSESLQNLTNKIKEFHTKYVDAPDTFNRVHEFAKIEAGLNSSNESIRNLAAHEAYMRMGGEVQARATQFRSGMTLDERRNFSPYFKGANTLENTAGNQLERALLQPTDVKKMVEGFNLDVKARRKPRYQYPQDFIID